MVNYLELAFRYLKMNKKRTIFAIAGTAIAAFLLFSVLSIAMDGWLFSRERERKKGDYEIVFYTESQEQIENLISDDYVRNASVGKYYHYIDGGKYYLDENEKASYEEGAELPEDMSIYPNATFVNVTNPYRMTRIFNYLSEKYGIEGELNGELSIYYFQNSVISVGIVAGILLVSILIAILGVGIIRNTIQIGIIEQIRDYGNLRCIGATKGQLRKIIACEAFVLETAGILLGSLIGIFCSRIAGIFFGAFIATMVNPEEGEVLTFGMHILPIIPCLIAFYFDLIFLVREDAKLITTISPVEAIRGNFRVKEKKIKRHRSGLFGLIFGVAGDYAYKNIRRNNGRFLKTTGAMTFGIMALTVILGLFLTVNRYVKNVEKAEGKYPIYIEASTSIYHTRDNIRSVVYNDELYTRMMKNDLIGDAKKLYGTSVYTTDPKFVGSKAIKEAYDATGREYVYKMLVGDVNNTKVDGAEAVFENIQSQSFIRAYDEEDYSRLEGVLTEGTLDVSENGIVAIQGALTEYIEDDDVVFGKVDYAQLFDYKLGDKVTIYDPIELEKVVKDIRSRVNINELYTGEEGNRSMSEDYREFFKEVNEAKKQLLAEGKVKEFTVEGIVERDNNLSSDSIGFVLPLEKYFEVTGLGEGDINGYVYESTESLYRTKKQDSINLLMNIIDTLASDDDETLPYLMIPYSTLIQALETSLIFQALGVAGVICLFIVIVNILNIFNVTSSSMYLRRKEFAQLRAIGISKKDLNKMVYLEGVIQSIIAGILGGLFGALVAYGLHVSVIKYILGTPFEVSWIALVLGIVLTLVVACSAIYRPLNNMNKNLAEDLMASE